MKWLNRLKQLEIETSFNSYFQIFIIGIMLNIAVIMFNGLKMPVYFSKGENIFINSEFHFPFTNFNQVVYPFLADIINLGFGKFSIGDVLLFGGVLGMIIMAFQEVLIKLKQRRENGIA